MNVDAIKCHFPHFPHALGTCMMYRLQLLWEGNLEIELRVID